MKRTLFNQLRHLFLVLGIVLLLAAPSPGADIALDLAAVPAQWTPPGGGAAIPMWGFVADTGVCPGTPPAWGVGPQLLDPAANANPVAGDNLTIHLRNCLGEEVSFFIAGQTATLAPEYAGNRVTSLTATVPANGATGTYLFSNLKPGSFIYHSGANLAKQVQMGLYGALIVDAAAGIAYNGGAGPLTYDSEVVLFYSEIDPARHDPPAPAYPSNYTPRYFLINGQPYAAGATLPAGMVGQNTVVRLLSACLDDIVPTLNGIHWDLVAEDGYRYPYPRTQYTALLSPLKTLDAFLQPTTAGSYALFDRRLNLTNNGAAQGGMLAMLSVGAGTLGAPTAADDTYTTATGTTLNVPAPGVLLNDSGAGTLTAILVSGPSNGSVTLNPNGSFSYTPTVGFSGADSFQYTANNAGGASAAATATITVISNTAPVANAQAVSTNEDTPLAIVLAATDAEINPLTYSIVTPPSQGTLSGAAPNVTYTPSLNYSGADSFVFKANDGSADSNLATVNITVIAVNDPPTATPDFTSTTVNTAKTFSLTANDTDPDGDLNPASVLVGSVSAKGGTILNLGNGSVTYTPRRNFRGTDTFTYTVKDSGTPPLTSNSATVTVNVVR